MKAYVIKEIKPIINKDILYPTNIEIPKINDNEVLIKVLVCGICHTELDEIEGRLIPTTLPIIPGHQIVGKIIELGNNVKHLKEGDRVGIGWINKACGKCYFCESGFENLCEHFVATGKDVHGGYAEYTKVDAQYAYLIPNELTDIQAAPLLCAGGVGYRSLKLTNLKNGQNIAFTGFGASAHIILQLVKYLYPDSECFVFARSEEQRSLALKLGANKAFSYKDKIPYKMHAIIDTTPVWFPVIHALEHLQAGGRLVINAIRKEDNDKNIFNTLDYAKHVWKEKEIKSVANVTRDDIKEFLEVASKIPIIPNVEVYAFSDANSALFDLKKGHIKGAKVLAITD